MSDEEDKRDTSDSGSEEARELPAKKGAKRVYSEDEDEADSESDGARKKSTKKGAKRKQVDPEEGIVACQLSKNRKVVVRQFKSATMIDIREYWGEDNDKPSKKGISLNIDQWKVLRDHVNEVDGAIADLG